MQTRQDLQRNRCARLSINSLKRGKWANKRQADTCIFSYKTTVCIKTKGKPKDKQKGRQRASKGQTKGKQRATIEDYIKTNKTKEEGKTLTDDKTYKDGVYFPNDELLDEAFAKYINYRKEAKIKTTSEAIKLEMKRVQDLSGGDNDKAIAIINQTISRGWRGLFELKEDKQNTNGSIDWRNV